MSRKKFIPALRFGWLTPLYDPLLRLGMHEQVFKHRLIEQADIHTGMQVLDVGCGTGTLTVLVKQAHPDATVVGMDGDPKVLTIAREKAKKSNLEITFDYGLAAKLPYRDQNFQRVLTSLVIHHLDTGQKTEAFREIYRVLEPGGELHLLDFGQPRSLYGRAVSHLMIRFEQTRDNLTGKLPEMIRSAGFSQLNETESFKTIFGDISVFKAIKSV